MSTQISSRKASKPQKRPMKRPSYRAARAFYITLLLGACLAAYAYLKQPYSDQHGLHRRQELGTLQTADEECRLVHRAKDQCAFIKTHCAEDEAGFAAYLDMFYCRLPHAKPVGFAILVAWLGVLFSTIGIAASDFFCINLSTIAAILGMSESMAGVTLLAFGNGSPDVFSTFAAMSTDSGSLAVGELFGAAGFITAVVAGSMALIRPFHVAKKSFIRDVGFFVVAAAFSMVFLWDGRLHLWECISMVAYYVVYVAFVVVWHWWIGRRRRRREKEAAARGHYLPPGDELDADGEYHDDPEEAEEAARPSMVRGMSVEDWSALEGGGQTPYDDGANEDDEEEARDRWMSELNSNMRLTRPRAHSRKNTISNVRPSLVGALEFQAVLKSLQKSRNIQTIPLHARRYSDDPAFTTAQQQDQMSSTSDPAARPAFQITIDGNGSPAVERPPHLEIPKSAPARTRAVSANDAAGLQIDPDYFGRLSKVPSQESIPEHEVSEFGPPKRVTSSLLDVPGSAHSSQVHSPMSLEVTGPSPRQDASLRLNTDVSVQSEHHLSLPPKSGVFGHFNNQFGGGTMNLIDTDSPQDSPRTVPSARRLPKIVIPREERSRNSTPATSPFPRYHDDMTPLSTRPPSLHLPPPISSPESVPTSQSAEHGQPLKSPVRWWPYNVMPPPGVIISTLFPTIYHWREKTWWEKCLGIVAAPSVFLLTITLPVVENDKDGEVEDTAHKDFSYNSARSKSISGAPGQSIGGLKGVMHESAVEDSHPGSHNHSLSFGTTGLGLGTAGVAVGTEQHHHHHDSFNRGDRHPSFVLDPPARTASPGPMVDPHEEETDEPELWNRWLTIVQLFTAPLLVAFAIWSQSPYDMDRSWIIKTVLICLLVSLVLLIPLLLFSTPTCRPAPFRTLLSLAGFVVSIAWISTIASQVVGALKALAVVLNMSHAIMGLTIFAVGNSLGDLVADVTVARLGYPVMALSACFGGPMLNILLGIGLSGSWILIRGADRRHAKHPDRPIQYRSYHIDVSTTLIISGATLLITLVGLLIFVPLNKWVLSRRIGWALIAVWCISTIGNVVVEVTGVGSWGSE
ncbi:hypothetical protein LTR10_010120 [Elasticomyces elasticus]|nr:hypothetical protein LTR10_010120 [Elasticomyces elasticus]KAK4970410.1 hypothetical protein LTR42_008579 [Elasticomyces elasticus]